MNERNDHDYDNRPATRGDLIIAVGVLIFVLTMCSSTDSCNRRLQIDKLRKDLQGEQR